MEHEQKDIWDKLAVILRPLGGFLTALAVAGLGFFGSQFLDRRQAVETNVRLYSELISNQEEAESTLRKDMFMSIIETFLKPEEKPLDALVLSLELLVYNFHESLNLKPLFIYLRDQIINSEDRNKQEYLERLGDVAIEITKKQILVLEGSGQKFERTIDLESLRDNPGGIELYDDSLEVENIKRHFRIFALKHDPTRKEIKIRLEIRTPKESSEEVDTNVSEFWLGFFDFPMIDNTRLSNNQRCAIVMSDYGNFSGDITLVYFPGAYASLKDKPYYHKLLQNLVKTSELTNESKEE